MSYASMVLGFESKKAFLGPWVGSGFIHEDIPR